MSSCDHLEDMFPLTMKIMALSISASKKAGVIIRDIMKSGDLRIIEKGHNDPQTEADRSVQKCIIATLNKNFPKLKIIGEEELELNDLNNLPSDWSDISYDMEFLKNYENKNLPENLKKIKEEDLCVWVDPLDGTNEYTQGYLDRVTVLIGIAFNKNPIGGVIHQPYYDNLNGDLGRTVWGVKGLGIGGFNNLNELSKSEFIVTTTRTHFNEEVQRTLEALKPTTILRVGGAGYKVLQLIDGLAHAYVFASPGCKKWDTCAPEAILEAHGGQLTDILGNHYEYHSAVSHPNSFGVLATAKGVSHQTIVDKIPESIKKSFLK